MLGLLKKSQVVGFMLIGLLTALPACTHQTVHQVGSHKVTVSRHGFQKNLTFDKRLATFEYEGVSTAGAGLKVTITGNKVKVNDADYGMLRDGDSVFIGDDGVAVNSLDYGESEKYLRANSAPSDATASK
jgi:ribosome-associated protein YbcJ (S4-like RNA binding protein)